MLSFLYVPTFKIMIKILNSIFVQRNNLMLALKNNPHPWLFWPDWDDSIFFLHVCEMQVNIELFYDNKYFIKNTKYEREY